MNRVAAALFASRFYPKPQFAGLTGNALVSSQRRLDNDQYDVKLDGRFRARHDVTLRYSHGLQVASVANSEPILLSSEARSPFHSALLRWAMPLGTSILNEARIGVTRIVLVQDGGVDRGGVGALAEALGIAGANRRAAGLPAILLSGAADAVGNSKVVQNFTCNTFQYQDNLLWQRGAHAMKAGVLVLRYQQNVYFSGNTGQLGQIQFNGQYTRDLNEPRSIGSPLADFFLGYQNRLVRGDFAGTFAQRNTLWSGYVQDDWRVSKNVSANLGVRYEYRTPLVEVHDRQANIDLASGRMLLAARDGNSRGLYVGYKWDWQPRVGIAWAPDAGRQRLVLRGAYTESSFQEGTGTNLRLTLNPPFFNEFERINADPAVLGPSIDTGFDALREKDPLTGSILRAWDPRLRPARSRQWSAILERQIGGTTSIGAGYIGQYGTHLVVPVNADQAAGPGERRPFDAVYPQIAGIILTSPNANQRYDALQVTARKRWSAGWSATASYAWSHALSHGRGFFSDNGGQAAEAASFWPDPRNRDADWGPASADVRHNITSALLWELPIGDGRRWLSTAPPWVDSLAGGWAVAAIWRAHSGFPITVTAPDQSQTGARSGRPDQIGRAAGPRQVGPSGLWFNAAAFVLPKRGTFGSGGVGTVRGPGLDIVDASISKRNGFARRYAIELRADVFNLFNTPAFDAPDRSLTSATFGRVVSAQLSREIQLGARVTF